MNPTKMDSHNVKAPSKMMLVGEERRAFSQQAMMQMRTIVPTIGMIISCAFWWANLCDGPCSDSKQTKPSVTNNWIWRKEKNFSNFAPPPGGSRQFPRKCLFSLVIFTFRIQTNEQRISRGWHSPRGSSRLDGWSRRGSICRRSQSLSRSSGQCRPETRIFLNFCYPVEQICLTMYGGFNGFPDGS